MVKKVRGFGCEPLAVLSNGGKHRFHRFLAEFLGAMGNTAIEQLAGVRNLCARGRALLQALFEVMEGEGTHVGSLSTFICRRGENLAGTVESSVTERTLDFWFDFASTYSYPAAMRIEPLAHAADVRLHLRPFLLGPIFKAQGWDSSPFNLYAVKGRYMWRDLERLCAELSLPFRRPEPFPQSSLLAARVALVGLDDAWGEDFCRGVFRAEFGEGRRIDQPTTIADLLAMIGC